MARTRASVAAKVASGKSSKASCCTVPAASSGGSNGTSTDKSSKSNSGGNPVCPRETPKWQKPITNFFIKTQTTSGDIEEDIAKAGSSKSKPKRNIIHSDDEEEQPDKPKNKALDDTIELQPLTGEDSHKINEYYDTTGNGKTDKENVDINNAERNKRSLDDDQSDNERNFKKVKV